MALWVCESCGTLYAVGAERCPNCGDPRSHEEGSDMPKITRHGGPTILGVDVPVDEGAEPLEVADEAPAEAEPEMPDDERTAEQVVASETVDGVKAWVDGDPERAAAALEAENASVSPRSTLVAALEAILAAALGETPAEPVAAETAGTTDETEESG